jgi:hypothetical protein
LRNSIEARLRESEDFSALQGLDQVLSEIDPLKLPKVRQLKPERWAQPTLSPPKLFSGFLLNSVGAST